MDPDLIVKVRLGCIHEDFEDPGMDRSNLIRCTSSFPRPLITRTQTTLGCNHFPVYIFATSLTFFPIYSHTKIVATSMV